ncbi:MAG TPA: hypothetical protein VMT28_09880 [Terriglobales bacterium]|jgi:hypothetical protein|nr:hypothetical protein [Terriglobales bacterium]
MSSSGLKVSALIAGLILSLAWAAPARAQGGTEAGAGDTSQSWSTSSQQQSTSGNLNPTRSSTKHTEANGRTVDRQTLERVGMDGQYVPYLDVERESIKVDGSTTRTVERTYGRDADGRKTLVQVTEEETRALPGGGQRVVRNISNPDVNGGLQLVRREIQNTRQVSPSVQETRTTVLSPDVNGGLTTSMQMDERQTTRSDHSVEYRKSTSLPDGAGNMQVMEVRQGTITEEGGPQQSKEESVLRPDNDGKLAVVERTVSKASPGALGEQKETVETYSTDLPGTAGDGSLKLVRREVTVERKRGDGGKTTEGNVEERNPGNPGDSPRVTQKTIDIVRPGVNGPASEQRTVLSLGSTGSLGAVWVDMGKTDNPAAVQVDTKIAAPATSAPPR